jgi:sulfite reductase alpha subunit-like flavoprotein
MEERNIVLLYGSETGTTEDHAQELGRTLERLRFNVEVMEMDAYDPVCITNLIDTAYHMLICILGRNDS